MTNQTRIKQARKALANQAPPAPEVIGWIDEPGTVTVNGETMTEAEFARRYPGRHKTIRWPDEVIRLGIDLSEV
jgi:hypothetical protein